MTLRFPHPGILLLLLIGIVGARLFIKDAEANLVNAGFTSGWLLFASFAVLGAYGLRKKLPFLPIGRTTLWLQLHLGLGLISTYLFFEHVGYRMPSGSFESLLYVVYAVLLCSGFIGWILMRTMPGPMRSDGMELNRSRIPDELFKLREESDRCMAEIKPGELSAGLMDSYFEVIRPYLWKGCGIFPSRIHPEFGVPRSLIDKLQKYVSPVMLLSSEQFIPVYRLVQKKAKLDLHQVFQRWLRGWLFIHVPLTSVMVLLVILHIFLAVGFRAGGIK